MQSFSLHSTTLLVRTSRPDNNIHFTFVGLFNVRGADIPYNPLFFSVAAVTLDKVFLFMDERKLDDEVRPELQLATILPYEAAVEWLRKYHADMAEKYPESHKVRVKLVEWQHSWISDLGAQQHELLHRLGGQREIRLRGLVPGRSDEGHQERSGAGGHALCTCMHCCS